MKIATKLKGYIKKAEIAEFRILDSLGLTSANSLRVSLNRLVHADEFHNPVRGIYVSRYADPFRVATMIHPGYLSLGTALYLYHLIEEYPFTIFVASARRASFRLGEHEIVYFKAKNYSDLTNKPYKMASIEKTIYDCLRHPELVGYAKIAKALQRAKFSAKAFLYLCKGESNAFFQRLGYILSLLSSPDKEKYKILEHCRKMIRANTYLQGRSRGKYIPEWKLVDNVGKKVILSWSQQ